MKDILARILIVDDEDIVLKSCLRVLQKLDYEIDTAYSGQTALDNLEKKKYDIVVTDLMMPGMDGMQLLEEIKKRYPDVIVIIFTGYATVDTTRQALKAGAFDYIPKPFTPDELRNVIDNAVKSLKNKK
ncbi:MAG: sigma-54-dependent Fis family transcriptional regulator [Spirochaetes bacterium]|nr:sigma-54-dependent Fis family transcriptional regulator [Spirochaetota bacterium]HOJ27510.1 response regulator [Spirochaetota bacterium]HOM08592.1 response regulator [Spirochaetota bacterium]HPP48411.1 response regulator [Spirochaetota bacterium]HXK64739.1 response regulator [Spirochaetota bacterium]